MGFGVASRLRQVVGQQGWARKSGVQGAGTVAGGTPKA